MGYYIIYSNENITHCLIFIIIQLDIYIAVVT